MPGMHAYRCYLLDAQSHIACAEVVECRGDDEVKLRAREILAEKPGYRAIEVWDRGRRVYIHPSGDDAAAESHCAVHT
jgi:hypothetical protein